MVPSGARLLSERERRIEGAENTAFLGFSVLQQQQQQKEQGPRLRVLGVFQQVRYGVERVRGVRSSGDGNASGLQEICDLRVALGVLHAVSVVDLVACNTLQPVLARARRQLTWSKHKLAAELLDRSAAELAHLERVLVAGSQVSSLLEIASAAGPTRMDVQTLEKADRFKYSGSTEESP